MHSNFEDLKNKIDALPEDFTAEQLKEVMLGWAAKQMVDRVVAELLKISRHGDGEMRNDQPDLFYNGGSIDPGFAYVPKVLERDYVVSKELFGRSAKFTVVDDLYLD